MFDMATDALILVGLLLIALLLFLILRALQKKDTSIEDLSIEANVQVEDSSSKPQEKREPAPATAAIPPGKPENEQQRLTRMEKELAAREAKVKAQKIKELQERESVIRQKEAEEKVAPPQKAEPAEDLAAQRGRVQEMIKKAEDRYYAGELEERNFKRIISEYQQDLIDIDIKMKKRR